MKRGAAILVVVLTCWSGPSSAQEAQPGKANTLLVLKNGAEVRGLFVGLKDGLYTLQLPDGRTTTYPAGDVDRMEPLADSSPNVAAAPPQPRPAATPFTCRTFISEKDVDRAFYTTLKDIMVFKKWYGSTAEMYGVLAEKARKAGADAVINVQTWYAPTRFAWASPHAGGMAVTWTDAGRQALPNLEGRCY
jgi:hypothetical protein